MNGTQESKWTVDPKNKARHILAGNMRVATSEYFDPPGAYKCVFDDGKQQLEAVAMSMGEASELGERFVKDSYRGLQEDGILLRKPGAFQATLERARTSLKTKREGKS